MNLSDRRNSFFQENLSLVALLSTACQESSKLRDIFDCLLILLEFDPVLLSEAAGDQVTSVI